MRFALLEAKIGVMAVMRRFSFAPGTKTKEPLEMDAQNQLAWPKGGLWARVVERKTRRFSRHFSRQVSRG